MGHQGVCGPCSHTVCCGKSLLVARVNGIPGARVGVPYHLFYVLVIPSKMYKLMSKISPACSYAADAV